MKSPRVCGGDHLLQIGLVADDSDGIGIDLDAVDDALQPSFAERHRAFGDILAHQRAELRHEFGGDDRGRAFRRMDAVERRPGQIPIGFESGEAFLQHVVEIGDAVLDELVEAAQLVLRRPHLGRQRADSSVDLGLLGGSSGPERGERRFEAGGLEQFTGEMIGDELVELVHGDRATPAASLALATFGRAGIIAMDLAGFRGAGTQGHCRPTMGAGGKPGQQDRPSHLPRRRHPRIMSLERRGDSIEVLPRDEGGNLDPDMLGGGLHRSRPGFDLVEGPLADIDGIGQDAVHGRDAEAGAEAGAIAFPVEPGCDGLDAERAGNTVTDAIEAEDQPYGFGFDRVFDETLLDAFATRFAGFDGIAERHARSVIEALPGVLLHGAQDVLGILAALVFVEQRDHLAHHHLAGIVAEFLRDRNQSDACFRELADIHLQGEGISEESRVRMHDDDVEGMIVVEAALDHALEFWPGIVGGGGARLDELAEERPALGGAELRRLLALVGDGEIGLGLASGRDTQVSTGAQRGIERQRGSRSAARSGHGSLRMRTILSCWDHKFNIEINILADFLGYRMRSFSRAHPAQDVVDLAAEIDLHSLDLRAPDRGRSRQVVADLPFTVRMRSPTGSRTLRRR